MLRYFITILLIFGSLSIFAQINVPPSKGSLILLVKDKKTTVRLDSIKYDPNNFNQAHLIDTGSYVLRAWVQGHELLEDTISVVSQKYIRYKVDLERTAAYDTYRKELTWYRVKKNLYRYVPFLVTGVYLINQKQKIDDLDDDLDFSEDAVNRYYSDYNQAITPNEFELAEKNFLERSARYDDQLSERNEVANQTLIVGSIGVIISSYLMYRSFKLKKPVYSPTPSLLSHVDASFSPILMNGEILNTLSITIKL